MFKLVHPRRIFQKINDLRSISTRVLESCSLDELESELNQFQGIRLDPSVYVSLLKRCANAEALGIARIVHAHIAGNGQDRDRLISNLLIETYGKCGSLEDSSAVFHNIQYPNVYSWTMMITALAYNGQYTSALQHFRIMDIEGLKADRVMFLIVLDVLGSLRVLANCRIFHSLVIDEGLLADEMLQNAVISMYGKCGSLDDAEAVFNEADVKDPVTWNALISAHTQNDQPKVALKLLQKMRLQGLKPDKVTFVSMIDACASSEDLYQGKLAHEQVVALGFESDVVIKNTLINMYGKCRHMDVAWSLFHNMQERSVITWNTIISAYAQQGPCSRALDIFRHMDLEGQKPTRVTFVTVLDSLETLDQGTTIHNCICDSDLEIEDVVAKSLINMYSKCGGLEDAMEIFGQGNQSSVELWTSMMGAFFQRCLGAKSLFLFLQMQQNGVKPDKPCLIAALDACVSLAVVEPCRMIRDQIVRIGLEDDVYVQTSFLNVYGKCGRMGEAKAIFDDMQNKDLVTWNVMLAVYVQHGHKREVMELFQEMLLTGERPDEWSLVRVIDACTSREAAKELHADIVANGIQTDSVVNRLLSLYGRCSCLEEAKFLFASMHQRCTVSYNTMIAAYLQDGLGREVIELFYRMQQEGVKPDIVTFIGGLDACASILDLAQGKMIHLAFVNSRLEADVILETALVHMYGRCGRLVTASEMFNKMQKKDLVSWNVIITAYAQHGYASSSLKLLWQMQQEGSRPDNVTFVSVTSACSHAGLLDEALECFISSSRDHSIARTPEQYGCILDLLGRSGRLDDAEEFMSKIQLNPDPSLWTTLLGACKLQGNSQIGIRAAKRLNLLEPGETTPYVLLSNIYAAS